MEQPLGIIEIRGIESFRELAVDLTPAAGVFDLIDGRATHLTASTPNA